MVYANEEIETMARPRLRALQDEQLRRMIQWLYEKSPFYRVRMERLGLRPADIAGVADLVKLPFTTAADLAAQSPFGLLTFPMSAVARLHEATAAGRPVLVPHTDGDLGKGLEMAARTLVAGGLHQAAVLQIALPYGMAPEALAVQYAAEVIGAAVAPAGAADPAAQWALAGRCGVTHWAGSPELLRRLGEAAAFKSGPHKPPAAVFAVTDAPNEEEWRALEAIWRAPVIALYSVPEIAGPGLAGGCPAGPGLHAQEDCYYPEIIDAASGQVLPPGRRGELVWTALRQEAAPALRYRTGRRAMLEDAPCPCGRTARRLIF